MMTTNRTANGTLAVLWNGESTQYSIFNGSLGSSGTDRNEYGIYNSILDKSTRIGSLQKAKKMVAWWLSKQ